MTYARPGEAERITKLKESERIAVTLKQLAEIFGGLRENFERGASKCWSEDEWSRGAWAFVGFDFLSAAAPDGRIHFAGAYADNLNWGMEAATRSANRVAEAIHRL